MPDMKVDEKKAGDVVNDAVGGSAENEAKRRKEFEDVLKRTIAFEAANTTLPDLNITNS